MNAIFTGRKRSGKTTLAFDIAMRNGGGIIIFDPKREWRGWPGTISSVSEIEGKIKEDNAVIVYHPQGDMRESFTPLADYVLELHSIAMLKAWDKTGDHFTFIVDEAVNVSTAKWVDEKLLSLVAQNRPEILDIFLTFQSPKDANNLLKSRVDNWFIFNTSLPSDLDYLNKEVGVPQGDLESIQNLNPHEYAHFYFDGGQPTVAYEYNSDSWFRPLEYFELNSKEREDALMSRDDRDSLEDIIKEMNAETMEKFFDDDRNREDHGRRRSDKRNSRNDRNDRSDRNDRRDDRRSSFNLTGRR